MAIEAGNVIWNIGADLKPLNQALGDSEKAVQSSMGNILAKGQQIGAAMTAIGAGLTAMFLGAVNATMDYGGSIQDASVKTGIAAEELQKLKFGAEQSGVSFEQLQVAILKMSDNLGEAAGKAGGPFNDALASVGLTIQQLQTLSPDQQFMKLATAIAGVADPAQRTTLAINLFGKAGAQLLPLLSQGAAGIMEAGKQAEKLGLIMSGESIAQSEKFGDQWDAIKLQFQAVVVQVGSALIPALAEIIPKVQEVIGNIIQWVQANPQLVATLATIGAAIAAAMLVLGPLLVMLPGIVIAFSAIGPIVAAVGAAFVALTGPIGLLVLGIAAVIAAGYALYTRWDEVKEGLDVIWDGIKAGFSMAWDAIKEIVSIGVKVVLAPFQLFIDAIQVGWDLLIGSMNVVVDAFDSVWNAIIGGFNWVGGKLQGVWDWINGMINSGIQGIVQAVNYLSSLFGLGDVFGGGDATQIPGKATGGPVSAGMPYIVGEKGEELFVPDSNGTIVPNGPTRGMMNNATNININGYNRDPRSLAQEISRLLANQQSLFARA